MKRLAFYAPMKAPTYPIPSGDREMARGLFTALGRNAFNWQVELASELRLFDGIGDQNAQSILTEEANKEIERLISLNESYKKSENGDNRWLAWITYHNYYKAPDLIGPAVSKTLNIPYLLIEASIAKKRYQGPWAEFAKQADTACLDADVIFYLTERDRDALQQHKPTDQVLRHLAPFLNCTPDDLPPAAELRGCQLLAVGMHRPGDKMESYKTIAKALNHLTNSEWVLSIVGDGKAHTQVKELFEQFGDKVRFCGQLDPTQMMNEYQRASVFLWPGVNEAFGMVFLEAQLAGLPIVAENRPGVRDVVAVSESLVTADQPRIFASSVDQLLSSLEQRQQWGARGREIIVDKHLSDTATETLMSEITRLVDPKHISIQANR